MGVLIRLALPLLLVGCGLEIGPTANWVDTDSIVGEHAPDRGGSNRALPLPLASGDVFRVVSFNVEMGLNPDLASEIGDNAAIEYNLGPDEMMSFVPIREGLMAKTSSWLKPTLTADMN